MTYRPLSCALMGALALAALGLSGAASPAWAADKKPKVQNPKAQNNAAIERTEGGHRMGNPDAEVKLAEFVSYTCNHCAAFAKQGDPVLKLFYMGSGKVSVEVRHIIRDVVDLTAALTTNCGEAKNFPKNHALIMGAFDDWMPKVEKATPGQKARWGTGDFASRRRAIASDIGFYELMERQGYSRSQLDQCLSDDARAQELIGYTVADGETYGIPGTPSFTIDGELLENVHSWETLQPLLDKAVKPHLKRAS